MTEKTSFGFQEIEASEKAPKVRQVFDSVAARYDVMNDFMSLGMHRLWKDRFVSMLEVSPGETLLDVAGGTGDIAFRLAKRFPENPIVVSDINAAMLGEGRKRSYNQNCFRHLSWTVGNAECLPFPSDNFATYTIAFGIRNVTHIDKALSEAYRVLQTGGRFLCLEFSNVKHPMMKTLYDRYSFDVIPRIGKMVAGDAQSYQYLVESIRMFPNQEHFAEKIRAAGFEQVSYTNLTGGVVAIHSGWKL